MSRPRGGRGRRGLLVLPVALLLVPTVLSVDAPQQDATSGGDGFDEDREFAGRASESMEPDDHGGDDDDDEAPAPGPLADRLVPPLPF